MNAIMHNEVTAKRVWVASGVVLAAWLTLTAWSLSPHAMWLDHGHMGEIVASLPVRLTVFLLGWTLMVIAMMLPGTLPILAHNRRMLPVLAGWMAVWLGFGAIAYLSDGILHRIVHHTPAVAGIIMPALLLLAGVYQLTPIKHNALARCRPEAMEQAEIAHTGTREQWFTGVRYGVNCAGSCWALMLLMMAFGGMNLVGMLLLGVVMTAERLTNHARMIALTIGVALIAAAVVAYLQ